MKDMNIYKLLYVVLIIAAFLFFIYELDKVVSLFGIKEINATELTELKQHWTDSIKADELINEDLALKKKDSIFAIRENGYKSDIDKLSKIISTDIRSFNGKVDAYKKDTSHWSTTCDEALNEAYTVIDDQGRKIIKQDSSIVSKDERILLLNDRIVKKDTLASTYYRQFLNAEKNNVKLKQEVSKQNNWWNRNKFSVGVVSGVILSATTAYAGYRLLK